jgi:hypothetical protein
MAFAVAFWPFILGCVLVAGGFAAIIIGYFGVSGTIYPGLQLPYLVSGVALGLALVIAGSALLVAHSLGRQARLLRRLLAEVQYGEPAETVAGTGGTSGAPETDGQLLVARGGRWYHRPGCLLLEGKTTEHITPHEADFRGLTPCRLCDPVVPARPVASPTDATEVIEGSRSDLGR